MGGHGPGRAHGAGREAQGLQGHRRQARRLHGALQGGCRGGARVRHRVDGVQHRGAQGAVHGHHRAVRRHRGQDRRHGRHRLRRSRADPCAHARAVPAVGGVLVRAGLDHVVGVAAHVLRAAPRHRREDRPHAHGLLRAHEHRRRALAHHQRRGHARAKPQPRRDAAHHLVGHHRRRARHDAVHQPAHDARSTVVILPVSQRWSRWW